MSAENAYITYNEQASSLQLKGDWTTHKLSDLDKTCKKFSQTIVGINSLEMESLTALDTAGALILYNFVRELKTRNPDISFINFKEEYQELYDLVSHKIKSRPPPASAKPVNILHGLGEKIWPHFIQAQLLLAFVGEMMVYFYHSIANPKEIRWRMILGHMEETGVNALPIVGLLSFLLGIVIGYQGGVQLRDYGANIFVVELVSLTMLRELAPMMTAVIVAGRSGSAFTAQIGTMKVTEEINAMQTMGMSPMHILVLPRMIALAITLPLLIVFADIMGVLGGMVMAATMLDVSFYAFFQRLPEAVSLTSFFLGVGKAPVFALIIAVVGCFQGFQVKGSGESVGRQTTVSVVQAIFILILADAIFSIVFSWLGI